MTHSLHRLGNEENLAGDFVVFAMSAKGINEEGSKVAMRRFFELALALDPINAGDMKTGNMFSHSREDLLEGIQDVSIVHAVYVDEEKVARLLEQVREADMGLSVVVSGLFDRVREISAGAGLRQHTVECSGGVWGRTELLPDSDVMQITTMCGHGMIAANLVERMARNVRREQMSAEEAAKNIAMPCVCGIFNPARAARLIEALAAKQEAGSPVAAGQTRA